MPHAPRPAHDRSMAMARMRHSPAYIRLRRWRMAATAQRHPGTRHRIADQRNPVTPAGTVCGPMLCSNGQTDASPSPRAVARVLLVRCVGECSCLSRGFERAYGLGTDQHTYQAMCVAHFVRTWQRAHAARIQSSSSSSSLEHCHPLTRARVVGVDLPTRTRRRPCPQANRATWSAI